MAKRKRILWGRVFAFIGTLVMLAVVFMITTNRFPSTTLIRSILKPKAAVTRTMNVLEIRYFPNDPDGTKANVTNALSNLLVTDITQASKARGYKDAAAVSAVQPVVKRVVTRYKSSPYTTGTGETFYESLKTMLTGDGEDLCSYIATNKIDQVWFWKDVGTDNGGFNQEYFMSWSNTMLPSGGYPPVCNGTRTFMVLGLDQNRTVAEALHSFGHSIEATMPALQGSDLFWTKWAGGTNPSAEARTCGNVHFPPNTGTAYDYVRTTGIQTNCEDWHADGTGALTNVTCTRWGCNQEGYMKYWLQNTPSSDQNLTYNGKIIPTWWSFLADTDNAILNAAASNQYLTAKYAAMATPGPVATTPTPKPPYIGPTSRCTPPNPSMSICNNTSTTCGVICQNSNWDTVATCAAGSVCQPGICTPDSSLANPPTCSGTMTANCGMPCTSNTQCASGSLCLVLMPESNQVINPGTSYNIKLVNKATSGSQTTFILDSIIADGQRGEETSLGGYNGTWAINNSTGYSGGSAKYTTQDGASVEFGSRARTLSLISVTHPNVGSVDVYVNDVYKGTLVMTSPTITFQKQYDLTQFIFPAATPTPAPTPVPTAAPTPAPTAPAGTTTITFDTASGQDTALNGIYPTNVVNWGTNAWYLSSPWGGFSTKSISFNADVTSKVFNFVSPKKIISIEAYNGGGSSTTVGISCSGNTTKTQSVASGAKVTITTGFTTACTTVTIGSSNGWNTNFDNIVYQ